MKLTELYVVGLVCMIALTGCGFDGESVNSAHGVGAASKTTTAGTQNANSGSEKNSSAPVNAPLSVELQRAVTAMQSGDYKASLAITQKALQENANDYQALSIQGMAKALQGDTESGLADVKKSYAINSNYVPNYYNLALVYKLQGQLDESMVWFKKVLEKDTQNVWSIYGIATIYADKGDDTNALFWLEKAIQLDSNVKEVAREQDHFQRFHGNDTFERLVKK